MAKYIVSIILVSFLFLTTRSVDATIIDGGNVSGFDTFIDTNTGREWMDMDSFFGLSTTDMVDQATDAGFTFATESDVLALLTSLPLTSGEWGSMYEPFMGDAPNREVIWGAYDDGGDPEYVAWAWANDYDAVWQYDGDNSSPRFLVSVIPNILNSGLADMNIWAFREGGGGEPVPEPATISLLAIGLVGLIGGAARKKLKKKKAIANT